MADNWTYRTAYETDFYLYIILEFLKDLVSLSTMVQKLNFYLYWKWVNFCPQTWPFLRQVDPRCDVIPRTKSEKGNFLKYFNVKFVLVFSHCLNFACFK